MQRTIYILSLALVILVMASCKKNYNYSLDQNVSPVSTLFGPSNNLYVKLNPSSGAQITFSWSPAQAADGSLVQYLIAFDTTSDFKHPIYEATSDNNGTYTTATLTHSTLNHIATLAGIQPDSTGNLYWTVLSTKGLNLVKGAQVNVLTVTHAPGFSDIPTTVYLTGSATEAGADQSKAIQMKQISTGVFEIYTSLQSGSYQFIDRTSGTPVTYYMNGAGLLQTGSTSYSGATQQVHLTVDFNNAVASDTVIKSVDVWYAQYNDVKYHLNYTGNSTWQDPNELIQEVAVSYGWEQRYKFRYTVNTGGADFYIWFGSSNSDNQEPSTTTGSYFWLVPVIGTQWDYCYKFNTPSDNGKNCTITVYMQPGLANYYHSVTPQ